MNNEKHFHAAKNLAYLVVVVIAAVFFYIFKNYETQIMVTHSFNMFFLLAVLGSAFLIALTYLISQSNAPKPKAVRVKKSPSKKRRSR